MSEGLQVAIEIGQKMKICLNSVHEHPPYFQEAWICKKKKVSFRTTPLNTNPTFRDQQDTIHKKNVNHSIYHPPYYQRPKINRAEFTNKIFLWTTLLNTHPTSEDQNQQGCSWIYEYFMSFRIYHPPYFQRRETQQQLQAQQLFSVSLSLAVH